MNTNPHKLMLSALALAIAGIAASGTAHGSAYELRENSVQAQGRAMAGSASAIGDASVVANNPAMMSSFDEKTFQLDVTTIDLSFEFEGGGNAAANGITGGSWNVDFSKTDSVSLNSSLSLLGSPFFYLLLPLSWLSIRSVDARSSRCYRIEPRKSSCKL